MYYSKTVLNIFNNPKNIGRISKPDGIADCYNEDNTAHVEFSFRIESGVITNCQFRAQANPYVVAICSTITQMLKGKMASMLFLDPYSIKKELALGMINYISIPVTSLNAVEAVGRLCSKALVSYKLSAKLQNPAADNSLVFFI